MDGKFGDHIKKMRKNSGLTQRQLAAQLGVSKSVVSYYELQERIPSPEILIKLASVFHVSTDYLLGIDPVEKIDVSGLSENDIELVKELVKSLNEKNKKK